MSSLLAVKMHSATRSTAVRNLAVIKSERDSYTVERLSDASALPATVERHFGIPASIVATAIEDLDLTKESRA